LLALLEEHELSVADLVAITDLPQSRVSTHLGKLREANVLHDRRVGASTLYRANAAMPSAASALWQMLRASLADATLRADAERRDARLRAREKASWPETVAGEMERHWSPGRTWESLVHGVASLLSLGDVLDVGCGDGWSARLLAPRCTSYVGLDRSEKVLSAARRRTKSLSNARFVLGEMEALPFETARFDHVLLFHVLVHAEDPSVAIAEAACAPSRRLAPRRHPREPSPRGPDRTLRPPTRGFCPRRAAIHAPHGRARGPHLRGHEPRTKSTALRGAHRVRGERRSDPLHVRRLSRATRSLRFFRRATPSLECLRRANESLARFRRPRFRRTTARS
jgi:SAM-dependent methyltransferase